MFRPGHRIGVLISGANAEWFVHVPTNTTVTVNAATIGLPFLRYDRTSFLAGSPTPRLREWLKSDYAPVTKATVAKAARTFVLPAALARPSGRRA